MIGDLVALLVIDALLMLMAVVTHTDFGTLVAGAALWLALRADSRARRIANIVGDGFGLLAKAWR